MIYSTIQGCIIIDEDERETISFKSGVESNQLHGSMQRVNYRDYYEFSIY